MNNSATITEEREWDTVIGPLKSNLSFNFKEIWRYRDLLFLFVKKDIITVYKQTVLGPIWFVMQPIFTTIMFTFIFGGIAKVPHGTVPSTVFFLGSITIWNYFSDTLGVTSKTFTDNASVFGKVYFPRIILPLSKVISGLIKLLIQFSLFLIFWVYYQFTKQISPNYLHILYFPFLLLIVATLSLGLGIIITSLTTKYRDLTFLIAFGIQLAMYATPVIYPLSICTPKRQFWLWLNPLSSVIEAFKYAFLGEGILNYFWLAYSVVFTAIVLTLGIIIFNKVEKRFIDTV